MPMDCKFCGEPIEQNDEKKWVTVSNQKLHYFDCKSPDAPRLKKTGTKSSSKWDKKEVPVVQTDKIFEILEGVYKAVNRVEEKVDALIAQTAYKKATGEDIFTGKDTGATLRNPEDVQKGDSNE